MSARRFIDRRVLGAIGAALLIAACNAAAHSRSETFLVIEPAGSTVHVAMTLPKVELERLAQPGAGLPSNEQVAAYLSERISVAAAGKDCARSAAGPTVAVAGELRRVELAFQCPEGKDLVLRSAAFFDLVPSHVTYARIRKANGAFVEQLIGTGRRDVAVSEGESTKLEDAGFAEYILLGIEHILTGPDHLAFVLGFVLISRRLRDLVFVITGFTIGHSVTLALAVTGFVRPHTAFIDVMIALTIALIGAENIAVASRRALPVAAGAGALLAAMVLARVLGYGSLPVSLLIGAGLFAVCYLLASGHVHDAARVRLVVTLVFGLIHGFAFAKDLIAMQLPKARLAELLFGFNLGVEVGQLLVVALLLAGGFVANRLRLAPPRPITVDVVASALVGLGVFWMVGRTYA